MESIVKQGSLGSILFTCQIISEDDIAAALEEQKKTGCRFGEALVTLGIVTQEDIDWALSNQLNIPYVRLKPDMVDRAAVQLVPAETARQFNLIPLIRAGDEISIAIGTRSTRQASPRWSRRPAVSFRSPWGSSARSGRCRSSSTAPP